MPVTVRKYTQEDLDEAVATERERCAALCEQWNTTPGSRLALEIRGNHPAPSVKTSSEMRRDAAHDTSCVGAFARARPTRGYKG